MTDTRTGTRKPWAAPPAGARYGSLEPTSKAFDRLMQEHKKERETEGARP